MDPDADGPSEPNEAAGAAERFEQQLAKDDEALQQLKEKIHEAERKSKAVIPEPVPEP